MSVWQGIAIVVLYFLALHWAIQLPGWRAFAGIILVGSCALIGLNFLLLFS